MTLQDLKRAERYAKTVRDTTKAMYEAAQKAVDDLEEAIRKVEREEEKRVPWEEAPEWANWAAMAYDGLWFWFDSEPIKQRGVWLAKVGGGCLRFDHPQHPDWENSKQRRPE